MRIDTDQRTVHHDATDVDHAVDAGPASPAVPVAPTAPAGTATDRRAPGRRRAEDAKHAAVVLLAVAAVVAGLALALLPYDRGLVGYIEGDRRQVATECDAAAAAAFRSGSEVLDEDGTWAGEPPCQRTAAYRLGLAALLAAGGLAALGGVVHRRRATAH